MSHTNSTTNYGLPQFITTDKPAWLTDVNVAYSAIDTAMKNNQTAAANAQGDATQALSDASGASTAAAAADAKGAGAIASIAQAFDSTSTYVLGAVVMYNSLLYKCIVAVTTPGPWTGVTNWERINVTEMIAANASDISSLDSEIDGVKTVASTFIGVTPYGGSIYAYKVNHVVTVYAYSIGTVTPPAAGHAYTLGTLPAAFRPVAVVWGAGTRVSGYKYDSLQGYKIDTNGDIVTYVYGGSEITNGAFCLTYITS